MRAANLEEGYERGVWQRGMGEGSSGAANAGRGVWERGMAEGYGRGYGRGVWARGSISGREGLKVPLACRAAANRAGASCAGPVSSCRSAGKQNTICGGLPSQLGSQPLGSATEQYGAV